MEKNDAKSRFDALYNKRLTLSEKWEKYSRLTLPRIYRDENFDQHVDEEKLDYQSFGAKCVSHLSNKMMLALFSLTRPFFRIDLNEKFKAELEAKGFDDSKLNEVLSVNERKAIKLMNKLNVRNKLIQVIQNLIVVGNCILYLPKRKDEKPYVISVRNYVVSRDESNNIIEIVIRKKLEFAKLKKEIKESLKDSKINKDGSVCLYTWIKLNENDLYDVHQYVDDVKLPADFSGRFTEKQLPWRVLTWNLQDGDDYGSGHVQDYSGSFSKISVYAKALAEGAILATEHRWLVNPEGLTSVQDFQNSANGEAIPGRQGDIQPAFLDNMSSLQVIERNLQTEKMEVGQAFLLSSATVRDAERVTAEEIRMHANELETGLGGAYTSIAIELQMPLAIWLLEEANVKVDGKTIEPMIITGLEALSRNGDSDNMISWIGDLAQIESVPPEMKARLKMDQIASVLASARGVDSSKLIMSQEEFQQIQQQTQLMQQQQAMAGVPGSALPQTPV